MRVAELQLRVQVAEPCATEIREQIKALNGKVINHGEMVETDR